MPRVRTQNAIRNADPGLAGFTLVEILVVVMVILIIAAIAIPNLVHGKMRANEAAAVSSVKTINTAQLMYADAFPEVGYSSSLTNLGAHSSSCDKPTSTNACLIMDEGLTNGMKNGYIFEILGDGKTPTASYSVTAVPESAVSGRCNISSSENGDIHISLPGGPITVGDKSVGAGSSGCE
jgi:prepilin-type N-terminal cleavage/methylation domain-containing protein